MSRYIDADELIKSVNGVSTHWLNEWSTLGVLAMIDKQPTVDAVQVVRCRECKWFDGKECCDRNGLFVGFNYETFFCADGERRTDD